MALTINGELVSNEVIEDELRYVKSTYAKSKSTSPPKEEDLHLLVKENITRKIVLRQAAEKRFFPVDKNEIENEIISYKKNHSIIELPPQEEEYMRNHFTNLKKIKYLIEEVIKDLAEPDEEHLKIFYQDNKKHYFLAEGYDFFEIGVAKVVSGEAVKDLKKNEELKNKIITYKKKFSPQPNYQEEIKNALGAGSYAKEWKLFSKEKLNPLIQEKLSFINLKETTSLEEEKNAFYFLYLQAVYHNYQPNFLAVKEQVRKDLKFELEERKIDIYVEKLMKESEIIDEKFI